MTTSEEKKMRPLKGGVCRLPSSPDDKGSLLGGKCGQCGSHFFPDYNNPSPKWVFCPVCHSKDVQDGVPLSTKGKVWTYTISHTAYPGTPMTPPFIVAEVELPEEVLVMTAITDCPQDQVKIGMEVELDFITTGKDSEGAELKAYVFKPVQEAK